MLSRVAVLACEGASDFGLGVTAEIFGTDHTAQGLPRCQYVVAAERPGLIRTDSGLPVLVTEGLDALRAADLAIVVCWDDVERPPPEPVLRALRDVVAGGGKVLSQCTGAFVLAAAGLLDGRRATTHWKHAAGLARRYPRVEVDPGVLYVDEGPVITSAGTAAGVDACLHAIRLEYGATVANEIGRDMVVAPHRDGGQAQFVPVLVGEAVSGEPDLGALREWVLGQLDRPLSVADLARQVHMSPRTFARWFPARCGVTPHQWLTSQRLIAAQELLERTDRGIEQIAADCGLTALMLRRHFARRWAITPQAYRLRFSQLTGSPG
ncbi:MAG TPA: helix-turn-helix domain-containing protein [Trebonia sp.]|jgi:transcriptional regulator GlxA family with amidase domain|nr:helix-turn-helix domain-containing protein [Trebonia sp.]